MAGQFDRTLQLINIYKQVEENIFGNTTIAKILNCSETTATSYIKKLHEELQLTETVEGAGKGK